MLKNPNTWKTIAEHYAAESSTVLLCDSSTLFAALWFKHQKHIKVLARVFLGKGEFPDIGVNNIYLFAQKSHNNTWEQNRIRQRQVREAFLQWMARCGYLLFELKNFWQELNLTYSGRNTLCLCYVSARFAAIYNEPSGKELLQDLARYYLMDSYNEEFTLGVIVLFQIKTHLMGAEYVLGRKVRLNFLTWLTEITSNIT